VSDSQNASLSCAAVMCFTAPSPILLPGRLAKLPGDTNEPPPPPPADPCAPFAAAPLLLMLRFAPPPPPPLPPPPPDAAPPAVGAADWVTTASWSRGLATSIRKSA